MSKTLAAAAALILLSGCATHRLAVQHPNPYGEPKRVNSTAFGWGALQKRTIAECDNSLIDEVRVKQNLGQSLLAVLTLGAVMSTSVEYVCAKTPAGAGPDTDTDH